RAAGPSAGSCVQPLDDGSVLRVPVHLLQVIPGTPDGGGPVLSQPSHGTGPVAEHDSLELHLVRGVSRALLAVSLRRVRPVAPEPAHQAGSAAGPGTPLISALP